ncbi:hypothetical protein Tco_1106836 [Tanacetum coccineum]
MCTYLKNMEGYKLNDLKLKIFDSIQEMFDRAFKRVNTFEDFRTDLVEGKEKRARTELAQGITKKQKVEDDKEIAGLKQSLEIIPDEEEVEIDAIPLAVKSPSIVDWKIHKQGRKSYYQIMRADGKSQMYMIFSHMLKSIEMEDLETLYTLLKAKYKSTRPVEDLDLVLWNDLKTMFEPHVENNIYMLVEKKYPLTPSTLTMMLENKLMIDYESEMAYQLLKFIIKQLKKSSGCLSSYRTSLASLEKVIEANLLRAFAFLFWSFLMCSIEWQGKLASNSFSFSSIKQALEPSELEALSVNNFHVLSGSGSFLLASSSFTPSSSLEGVSSRKSANICPLTEFLTLNSISCSPNSIAYLAMRPDFSSLARTSPCSVRLTKYTGTCFLPLSVINTALILSSEAARYIIKLLSVRIKGSVLSAPFERKRFRAAVFLLRFCISLTDLGGYRSEIAFTFKGFALIPCFVMRCPENIPSSTPKEHFFGLSFRLIT